MKDYDYMRALWVQFCTELPQNEDLERLHRRLRDSLSQNQRRQLLRLIDDASAYCEEVSLRSFVAGFQLAAGIARETLWSSYSFAEAEEERASRQC